AQQNGLGGHEAIDLNIQRLLRVRIVQSVEEIDVQFVGALASIGVGLVGDVTAVGLRQIYQLLDFVPAQDSLRRANPDPVVRGQEIKIGGLLVWGREAGRTAMQVACVAAVEGVQGERRQGELVDELGFVAPVAEVTDVLGVRDIGLSDKN